MDASCSPAGAALVVSVVSHGHTAAVRALLGDLARHCAHSVARVVLTLNLPDEPEPVAPDVAWPFALQLRRNTRPRGFGANHNRALADVAEPFVCVLNPDVRLAADPFAPLCALAAGQGVGAAYPRQLDGQGRVQDSERALPTPLALWRRRVLGRSEARVDWVNAACLVLPAAVWRRLGGFDERYHMYCEDVDLCLRLRLAGLRLVRAPVAVLHAGERASHRSAAHLAWHVRSLLRLWRSPVYRAAARLAPPSQAPLAREGQA
ncbi:glycosyltransferase [Comamonas flocculans]|uniref:Glycosyltransferase family 2 protein n=1 Tax=Comamonas flocculans TaxID=2597701 RepID=A0A5B8RUF5_9BURK|nr:glycosyltransferase [Comamonas flocculans]QEA13249.1 glycosyltransferase family 2 protein [Comamonas flocculans]